MGDGVRAILAARGVKSVAAEGFGAPGVVVSYTDNPEVQSGRAFLAQGTQIAAGVPLECDEPEGFATFRIGLFGLDKLYDVEATLARLTRSLDAVIPANALGDLPPRAEAKFHHGPAHWRDVMQHLHTARAQCLHHRLTGLRGAVQGRNSCHPRCHILVPRAVISL